MTVAFDSRGFKIRPVPTLDGVRYPPLRKRGARSLAAFGIEDAEEGQPLPGPLPNTRLWPFLINDATIGQRALAASPRFSGPAYIIDMFGTWTTGTATEVPVLSLLYSNEDGGTGANIADTTLPTGNPIFERITLASGVAYTFNYPFGVPQRGAQITSQPFRMPIGYIVREPSFFLKITMDNQAAGGMEMAAFIRLLENIDPRTFRFPTG